MAVIGYIRVSSDDQNLARQEELMKRVGVDKVFSEKVSGKNRDRPELQAMLNFIREGDTVFVESISRLSRSTKDFLDMMEEFGEKGINFESAKEGINTNTPYGKLGFTIFAALSEFERETIRERQAEGIAIAKAEGKYKGRARIAFDEEAFARECDRWRRGETTPKCIQTQLGLKPSTFWRRVREMGGEV
jgi:DNA invertase Pin-like site-specific DNA recombinase